MRAGWPHETDIRAGMMLVDLLDEGGRCTVMLVLDVYMGWSSNSEHEYPMMDILRENGTVSLACPTYTIAQWEETDWQVIR